jgi:hypothetical protein
MEPVLTPCCPLCDQPPYQLLGGGTQAFCGTRTCKVLTWNPRRSIDQNLLGAAFVSLTGPED